MEKLNMAEILKDCPSGMKLDCTMFDDNCVEFDHIVDNEFLPIRCRIKNSNGGYNVYNFTKYGCWIIDDKAKCVIFPKGKTTWEGFQRPFKDGDILVGRSNQPFIFKKLNNNYGCFSYCGIAYRGEFCLANNDWAFANSLRFATEEEKQKLFDAIKENGYKWNAETKNLEKLIVPKFKVGDKITNGKVSITIGYIDDDYYYEIGRNIANRLFIKNQDDWKLVVVPKFKVGDVIQDKDGYKVKITDVSVEDRYYTYQSMNTKAIGSIIFNKQNSYELVPNKFDITTLNPFDKVLVRDNNAQKWTADLFSFFDKSMIYPYSCVGHYTDQCIPYNDETKHLLGTTDDCDEYYKTWE